MRPRQWEGRRSRGSVMSRRKQDCPWQSCKRARGLGVVEAAGLGR